MPGAGAIHTIWSTPETYRYISNLRQANIDPLQTFGIVDLLRNRSYNFMHEALQSGLVEWLKNASRDASW